MPTPEQTNEREGDRGSDGSAGELNNPDAGRPIIRPGPPGDGDAPTADSKGDQTPDEAEAGRPIIRPGPPGG